MIYPLQQFFLLLLSHQHHRENGDFIRAAARGLRPNANQADRFAAGALAQTLLVGGGLAYSGFKDLGRPLNELREQIFGRTGPSHRDVILSKDIDRGVQDTPVSQINGTHGEATNTDDVSKSQKMPLDVEAQQAAYEKWGNAWAKPVSQINGNNGEATNSDDVEGAKKKTTAQKEKAKVRKEKRKLKKLEKKKQQAQAPTAKPTSQPKAKVPPEISHLRSIAKQYWAALKNPASTIPPPLGGSGLPTNIVMGYVRATLTASTVPGWNASSCSATTVGLMMHPAMFQKTGWNYTASKYIGLAPIITFANAAGSESVSYDTCTTAATNGVLGWSNSTPLTNIANNCRARMLSGGLSISIRCNGTSKAPILFAGTIESFAGSNLTPSAPSGTFDIRQGIGSYTWNGLLTDQSFTFVDGTSVSNNYRPNTTEALELLQIITDTTALSATNPNVLDNGFPYVGATGLSSECVIYIEAVAWYEMLPNINARLYALGQKEPRINPTDVFNELPKATNTAFISNTPLRVKPENVARFSGTGGDYSLQSELNRLREVERRLLAKEEKTANCFGCGNPCESQLCQECQLILEQSRKVQDELGVSSVHTTPEFVQRKLDVLKREMMGVAPPARDLLSAGIVRNSMLVP